MSKDVVTLHGEDDGPSWPSWLHKENREKGEALLTAYGLEGTTDLLKLARFELARAWGHPLEALRAVVGISQAALTNIAVSELYDQKIAQLRDATE